MLFYFNFLKIFTGGIMFILFYRNRGLGKLRDLFKDLREIFDRVGFLIYIFSRKNFIFIIDFIIDRIVFECLVMFFF